MRRVCGRGSSEGGGGRRVSGIIAGGSGPAASEMMDRVGLKAIKAATQVDWPDVAAALLMDVDGPLAEVEHTAAQAIAVAEKAGAIEIRRPRDDADRAMMWRGRRSASPAMGLLSPHYLVQPGGIP